MSKKKGLIGMIAILLALVCMLFAFVACDDSDTQQESVHFDGDCLHKGYTRFYLPHGGYFDREDDDFGEHSYDNGATAKAATCTSEGETKYTCSLCGDFYTVATAIDPSSHVYTRNVTKQPSCTQKGEAKYVCSCGASYVEEMDKLSHSYTSEVVSQPTCSRTGLRLFSCACGDSYTEQMDETDHKPSDTLSFEGEFHWHDCAYGCGTKIGVEKHNILRQQHGTTCMQYAYTHYYCSDCDYEKDVVDESGDFVSHKYEAYTCAYCNRDMMLDYIEEFETRGNSAEDKIIIENADMLVCLIDYINIYHVTSDKYFLPSYVKLTQKNINNFLSNLAGAGTATNWSYSVKHNYNTVTQEVTSVALAAAHNDDYQYENIATVSPYDGQYNFEVYRQLNSLQFGDRTITRPVDFDDFAYLSRKHSMEVSNSEQLFFAFEHGYKPVPVAGSKAQTILEQAKSVARVIIDDDMSDLEKIRAIFLWLVEEVSYDYGIINSATANSYVDTSHYAEGVFNFNIAVCDGISKAYCILAGIENIKCVRVISRDHAWNKVWLDVDGDGRKEWYCSDATWANNRISVDGEKYEYLSLDDFLFTDAQKSALEQTAFNYRATDCEAVTEVNPYALIYYGDADYFIEDKEEMTALFKYLSSVFLTLGDGEALITVDFYIPDEFCTSTPAVRAALQTAAKAADFNYSFSYNVHDGQTGRSVIMIISL